MLWWRDRRVTVSQAFWHLLAYLNINIYKLCTTTFRSREVSSVHIAGLSFLQLHLRIHLRTYVYFFWTRRDQSQHTRGKSEYEDKWKVLLANIFLWTNLKAHSIATGIIYRSLYSREPTVEWKGNTYLFWMTLMATFAINNCAVHMKSFHRGRSYFCFTDFERCYDVVTWICQICI